MKIMMKYFDKRAGAIAALKDYNAMRRILCNADAADSTKTVRRDRYRQAKEYMDWFSPAWEQLPEQDRYVLASFYIENLKYDAGACFYVGEYLGLEKTATYRKRNRALDRLGALLFGK